MLPKVEIKRKSKIQNYKISNFMPVILEKYKNIKPRKSFEISEIYKEVVGEEISLISSVLNFENGVMMIKVKTVVWKNELKFREEEIKKMINSKISSSLRINKIIFK